LKEEVGAWEADRNKKHAKADWQFATADARVIRQTTPRNQRRARLVELFNHH
jgi:hypothetical protein